MPKIVQVYRKGRSGKLARHPAKDIHWTLWIFLETKPTAFYKQLEQGSPKTIDLIVEDTTK